MKRFTLIAVSILSISIATACLGQGAGSSSPNRDPDALPPVNGGDGTGGPTNISPPAQVMKWLPSAFVGNASTFADGIRFGARFAGPNGIAADSQGNLYIADTGNHVIRKIAGVTNTVSTFAGTGKAYGFVDGIGTAARFNAPQGISYDGLGNLWVADTGNSAIRKIVLATGMVTTIAGIPMNLGGTTYGTRGYTDGSTTVALFSQPVAVVFDRKNSLFVVDSEYGVIRKIDLLLGIVSTFAGGNRGSAQDGIGTAVKFELPMGAIYDGQDAIYIADFSSIRKLQISTASVTTLAGGKSGFGAGFNDGTGLAAGFDGPQGITYDGIDSLYVADTGGDDIRRISISTGVVTTFAGAALQIGPWDGIAGDAGFYWPAGITYDGNGSLYVSDTQNNAIRKIDIASQSVTTIAGASTAVDGIGTAARLYKPVSMAFDGNGNMFVLDAGANNIRRVEAGTAAVSTIAGNAQLAGDYQDGIGTGALFNNPWGIASDGDDRLFVADTDNNRIRLVRVSNGAVVTLAGYSQGSTDGTGITARFAQPRGIAYDPQGFVYIADTYNHTIRKVVISTGNVTTLAGTPSQSCQHADGTGANAQFCFPAGLAYDPSGNLYISDRNNGYIRKLNVATRVVTTVAGNIAYGPEQDGIGTAAKFNLPTGLNFDGKDSLLVADMFGQTVRKVSISTGLVTTIGGADPACYYPSVCPTTYSKFGNPVGIAVDQNGAVYVGDTMSGVITKLELR